MAEGNTWEGLENLKNTMEKVEELEKGRFEEELRRIRMKKATKKLMEKFIGLYVVRKIVSENTVELELPVSLRVHPVVNVRRLVKYKKQVEGQKTIPPPPVKVAGEKEYEVEEILDRQERRGKMRYLVK